MKIKVAEIALAKVLALLLAGAGVVECSAQENDGDSVLPVESVGVQPPGLRYEISSVSVHDKAVCVPIPADLVRIKEGDPAIEYFLQADPNDTFRLLACFVQKEQLEKPEVGEGLKAYAFLSESVSIGTRRISAREFKELAAGVKLGLPKFGADLTCDITKESLTPELKTLISTGKMAEGDYRCWLKLEEEYEGDSECRIVNGRYETLKYGGKTFEEVSFIATSFVSINSHFLVLKMVRNVDDMKDADAARKQITDDIKAWVADVRRETSEKCIAVVAPEDSISRALLASSEAESLAQANNLMSGLMGQALMCLLILLAALAAAMLGRRAGRSQQTPECVTPDGPVGIAGWNLIPMLNLLAIVVISLYQLVTVFWPAIAAGTMQNVIPGLGNGAISVSLGALVLVEAMIQAVMATLAVRILLLAFSRSRLYPRMGTWFFWLCAFFALADTLAGHGLGVACTASDVKTIVSGFVFAMIWGSYFKRSKRVRSTFVR